MQACELVANKTSSMPSIGKLAVGRSATNVPVDSRYFSMNSSGKRPVLDSRLWRNTSKQSTGVVPLLASVIVFQGPICAGSGNSSSRAFTGHHPFLEFRIQVELIL